MSYLEREAPVVRGFGKEYEGFAEEIENAVDADSLVDHLHEHGYTANPTRVWKPRR